MYPSQTMSNFLCESDHDRRLQGPLSQPGPESEGVHFVEKGWVAYIQAKNSGMSCAILIQK